MTGRSVPLFVLMGYPTGGVIWILAAWINESVVVTECGIVSDLRRTNRAVVWSQITDYFTKKTEGRAHFVFFYQGDEGTRRRVDLPVPDQEADLFHQFVKRKLDARFRVSVDDVSDPGEIPKPDDRVDLS